MKTSLGAVKKKQFIEFLKIARTEPQLKLSLIVMVKPKPSEVKRLQKWADEFYKNNGIFGPHQNDDILFSIVHMLD